MRPRRPVRPDLRAAFVNDLVPPASEGAYPSAPRVLRNAFVEKWHGRDDEFQGQRPELADRMRAAMRDGTVHELMVITGEVAGAIDDVLPAAEIVRRMATEAEEVLRALTAG
jgi:NAD(P)H-dependent flavin oxidoreductase YrpB (nitropropane dioxygenase family)